jgi:hypothetical protein
MVLLDPSRLPYISSSTVGSAPVALPQRVLLSHLLVTEM